jgi:hypothetical protein
MRKIMRTGVSSMAKVETSRARILARLKREGWVTLEGSKHDKLCHIKFPGTRIMVPRHRTLTFGVAHSIAKAAGWIKQERMR